MENYGEETCMNKTESPVEAKFLDQLSSQLDTLYNTIANRVADFKQINDSLFGMPQEKEATVPPCTQPSPNGSLEMITEKLLDLRRKADLLMPEVRRLSKLV